EEVPLYESKGKQFAQKPALPPGLSPEVVQKAKEKRERDRLRQLREEQQRKEQQQNKKLPPGVLSVDGAAGAVGTGKNVNAAIRSKKTPELPDILLEQQRPVVKAKQTHQQQQQQQQQHSKSSQQKPAAASNSDSTTMDELASVLASGAQLKQQTPAATGSSLDGAEGQQLEVAKKLRKLRKKIREIEAIETKLRSTDGPKLDKDQLEKVKRKPDILQEIEELEVQYSAGAM
uniref:Partner of Y14 and mago n=1 Tax=Anopheles maculatus TaxID=74869 RepID=A0A182T5T6_9DIPT